MTINYSGNPANVTTPLTATVTSCANGAGSLVQVQTGAAHLFSTNDYVVIVGVVGTTEANGTFAITVVDSTHFLLRGTTFVNAYVSGGAVTDKSLSPYGTMPSDGEPGSVAQIESFMQLLADRTAYLRYVQTVLGADTIRHGSTSDMTGVTSAAPLSVFYVPGAGLYNYNATSTSAVDGLLVYYATGMGGDVSHPGRWLHELFAVANGNPGVAVIGVAGATNGRIPASVVPNGIVGVKSAKETTNTLLATATSTTRVDLAGLTVTFSGATAPQVGDILVVQCGAQASVDSGGGNKAALLVRVVDNGSTVDLLETLTFSASVGPAPDAGQLSMQTSYVVTGGTSLVVKISLIRSTGTTNAYANGQASLAATLIRP